MNTEKEIVATFVRERETKNTVRFAEQENEEGPPVIGTVYIQKYALKRLGSPEKLLLTIRADE